MHAVTVTYRVFFSRDMRPEALLGMFRMAHPSRDRHRTSLATRPSAARARNLQRSCKGFRYRAQQPRGAQRACSLSDRGRQRDDLRTPSEPGALSDHAGRQTGRFSQRYHLRLELGPRRFPENY